jgi:CDGSH-type Zn-finger protein
VVDESAHRQKRRIRILRNGPYVVTGGVPLTRQRIVCDEKGESIAWREGEPYPVGETCSLCRCGATRTPPFCDGTHAKIGFDGTETASRTPYLERARWIEGAGIRLSRPVLHQGRVDPGPRRAIGRPRGAEDGARDGRELPLEASGRLGVGRAASRSSPRSGSPRPDPRSRSSRNRGAGRGHSGSAAASRWSRRTARSTRSVTA